MRKPRTSAWVAGILLGLVAAAHMQKSQIIELRQQVDFLQEQVERIETQLEDLVIPEPVVVVSSISKDEPAPYSSVPACSIASTFKSYMDYRMITDTSSSQWRLQQEAYTGDDGNRYIDGRIMVAMADQVVGTKIDLVFADGDILEVIIGDIKAGTDCEHPDGSIVEFIVDTDLMDSQVRYMGNYDIVHGGSIAELRIYS